MSDINNIEELPEFSLPINLKSMDKYQRKYPILMAKYKNIIYKTSYFGGGVNIDLNLIP